MKKIFIPAHIRQRILSKLKNKDWITCQLTNKFFHVSTKEEIKQREDNARSSFILQFQDLDHKLVTFPFFSVRYAPILPSITIPYGEVKIDMCELLMEDVENTRVYEKSCEHNKKNRNKHQMKYPKQKYR